MHDDLPVVGAEIGRRRQLDLAFSSERKGLEIRGELDVVPVMFVFAFVRAERGGSSTSLLLSVSISYLDWPTKKFGHRHHRPPKVQVEQRQRDNRACTTKLTGWVQCWTGGVPSPRSYRPLHLSWLAGPWAGSWKRKITAWSHHDCILGHKKCKCLQLTRVY